MNMQKLISFIGWKKAQKLYDVIVPISGFKYNLRIIRNRKSTPFNDIIFDEDTGHIFSMTVPDNKGKMTDITLDEVVPRSAMVFVFNELAEIYR